MKRCEFEPLPVMLNTLKTFLYALNWREKLPNLPPLSPAARHFLRVHGEREVDTAATRQIEARESRTLK